MKECSGCGSKKYGYTDEVHVVFICFRCGSFDGLSGGDDKYIEEITNNPEILLALIKKKRFKPMG